MGVGGSKPLEADPRCAALAPVWGPFVDAFVDTLHANGAAVHPPPPRATSALSRFSWRRADVLTPSGEEKVPNAAASETHALRSPGAPGPVFRPAVRRLVAVGDLHGDLAKTKEALVAGGLMDPSTERWSGGTTTAVQVGDQLDRGGDEVAILLLLERLRKEARDAGGELVVMNGNHETLNVAGRFRYATADGLEDFRRWRGRQCMGAAMKHACGVGPGECSHVGASAAEAAVERSKRRTGAAAAAAAGDDAAAPGRTSARLYSDSGPGAQLPRLAALAPGGPMARRFLAHQPLVVAVGSTVFAHGGVLPHHVDYGLERINKETSDWVRGNKGSGPPPVHVSGRESVVWARDYSMPEKTQCDCDVLEASLSKMPGMKRVVVGHTIQAPHGVNAACDGKVLRVDVGMSKGCGDGKPEVLEILDDGRGGVFRLSLDESKAVVRERVAGVAA
jgi:hypothetical protein